MERVFSQRPEIKDYFPLMVTSDDIQHSKPAPDCYLKAAEMCRTKPHNCIVFEDSLAGIESALNAHMKVVALSTTHPICELQKKTNIIIPDFTNITLDSFLATL